MRGAQWTAIFFDIQGTQETGKDEYGTLLPNDEAALAYARRTIRELREAGGYDDPALFMLIKNELGRHVASISFVDSTVIPNAQHKS